MDEFIGIGQVEKRDPRAHASDPRGTIREHSNGLTKREYFAGLAMQGFLDKLSNITTQDPAHPDWLSVAPDFEGLAAGSVKMADALIAELNKENK